MKHKGKGRRRRIRLGAEGTAFAEKRTILSELPLLAYLLSGLVGLLLVLDSVRGVSFGPAVYLWPIAMSVLLWAAWTRGMAIGAIALAAASGALALVVWSWWDVLPEQVTFLFDSLRGLRLPAEAKPDPWQAGVAIGCALAILLYGMECLLQAHTVPYLLTTAILAISPFLAVRITAISLLPLIVFQTSFWALRSARKGSGRRNIHLARSSGALRSGSWMAAVSVVLLFAMLAPLLANFSDGLYGAANEVEGFASRTFRNTSESDPITDGQLGLGNNYPTGTVKLELETIGQPTETMYLRGFRGGEYNGGYWRSANEDEVYMGMEDILHWGRWSSSIPAMLNEMYYVMNEMMLATEFTPRPEPGVLTLRHPDGDYDNSYVPYYSRPLGGWNYRRAREGENGEPDQGPTWRYGFRYFQQSDMNVRWDNINPSYTMVRDWYRSLQGAYLETYGDVYTRVPREMLPQLCALVEEHPLEDMDEITSFILYTLQNGAQYSLTPGWAPVNNDIVEYFLFERKSGYCVHFASAATLMYRLYGVPARYAAGYAVTPDQFEETQPGLWTAEVTDDAAHAWVEIFLPDMGWTPVEVTPASDGTMVAAYPGYDMPKFSEIVAQEGWTPSMLAVGGDSPDEEAQADPDDATGGFFTVPGAPSGSSSSTDSPMPAIVLCLVACAAMAPVVLECRRLFTLSRLGQSDSRAVFGQLLDLVHYCGALTGCDGTEPDFPARLAGAIPGLSVEDAKAITRQVEAAAYGPESANRDKDASLLVRTYWRAAASLGRSLGRIRRWVAKYVHRFF